MKMHIGWFALFLIAIAAWFVWQKKGMTTE